MFPTGEYWGFMHIFWRHLYLWLYPENPSNNSCPALLSTKMSMCGKGKSSLGPALLRSRKSTHMRTLPSFFGTGTMLANHSGYSVTTRNPAFSCFSTSSFIFKCLFGPHSPKFLLDWLGIKDTKGFFSKFCLCWVQAYHRRTMQRHPCILSKGQAVLRE